MPLHASLFVTLVKYFFRVAYFEFVKLLSVCAVVMLHPRLLLIQATRRLCQLRFSQVRPTPSSTCPQISNKALLELWGLERRLGFHLDRIVLSHLTVLLTHEQMFYRHRSHVSFIVRRRRESLFLNLTPRRLHLIEACAVSDWATDSFLCKVVCHFHC